MKGTITNYFDYVLKWKDGNGSSNGYKERVTKPTENDDVGGSGGRNTTATVLKWKTMMLRRTKGRIGGENEEDQA